MTRSGRPGRAYWPPNDVRASCVDVFVAECGWEPVPRWTFALVKMGNPALDRNWPRRARLPSRRAP